MSEFVVKSLGEAEQTARYAVKHGQDRTGAIGLLLAEYDARGTAIERVRAVWVEALERPIGEKWALMTIAEMDAALDGTS